MYKFLSWYNRNRKEIWITLIAVIIIVAIGYYILTELTESDIESDVSGTDDIELNNSLNSVTLTTDESVLTGDTVTTSSEKLETIDMFIEYCNNQDIESAYDLLSEECKDEMYQDMDSFKTVYYDSVFADAKKTVEMENWIGDTYKVYFREDLLSTGEYNSEEAIQDYITIVKNENSEYKLNINGFVKRTYSSKSGESNGLTINIKEINTYMNYETYTFEVINFSGCKVVLGDLDTEYTTYLVDENNNEYTAYLHELSSAQLKINVGQTSDIEIKYYNKYSSSKEIEYILFNNITFENDDEESYEESIKIDL